jgi:hypothetical protein
MEERDVLRMLLARSDNYSVARVKAVRGRLYDITMNGQLYRALILVHSFSYYELRYHVSLVRPTLVVCYIHDSVLPIPVLSTRIGNYAQAYELPEQITDIATQRATKVGSQVLLGMYMSGVRSAQEIFKELPVSTRNRYLQRVEELGKRKRGKPVGLPEKKAESPADEAS